MKRAFALLLIAAPTVFAVELGPERRLARTQSDVIVATAGGYVAFWNDGADMKGVHIAPDGTMGTPATVVQNLYVGGAVRDGDSIVVIAEQSPGFLSPIEVFRVGPDLHLASPIAIFGGGGQRPSIVADRGELFAGWLVGEQLFLAHLDPSLHAIRQRVFRLGTGGPRVGDFVLAPSVIGLLVAWNELIPCAPPAFACFPQTRVRAARVSFDLTADATGIDIGQAGSTVGGAWWDGAVWNVLWNDDRRTNLSRIDASGTLLDFAPRVLFESPSLIYFGARGVDGYVAAHFVGTPPYITGVALARLGGDGVRQASLLSTIYDPIHIVPGDDGRALFGYNDVSELNADYRIVDFNAEGGRPRPARR